jgi:hypothetical protein
MRRVVSDVWPAREKSKREERKEERKRRGLDKGD